MISLNQGQRIEKYEVIAPLNTGNFGAVFKMRDTALNVIKAVKFVEITGTEDYKDALEAQLMHRCRHENCVHVNEVNIYRVGGVRYYAIDMEFAAKGSLEGLLETDAAGLSRLLSSFCDVLYGLAYAHGQGVIHADIKPGNILLFDSGAKLSDFGLAFSPAGTAPPANLKYFTHCAPEMIGSTIKNVLTDIYATGVTLFRALNRLSDWDQAQSRIVDVRMAIRNGTFLAQIGYEDFVPSQLRRVVNKACHVNPALRYQSAAEMRQALERLPMSVDWRRIDAHHWSGTERGKAHEVEVTADFDVVYKVNGRRRTELCSEHASRAPAVKAMHKTIAKSSLA